MTSEGETMGAMKMVFMDNGYDRIVDATPSHVILEKGGKYPADHFAFGVARGRIKVTDDRLFKVTYRWLDGSGDVTLEMIAANETDANERAIHPDWFDPESQTFVGVVEA